MNKSTDLYGVSRCAKCNSLGTIVDLGKCCAIRLLEETDAALEARGAAPVVAFALDSPAALPVNRFSKR